MNNDLTLNMKIAALNNVEMDVNAGYKEEDPIFRDSPAYTITEEDITSWNNKSDFSGNYDDLTNKPFIPTKVSELDNDSGFITKNVNDLTNYTKTSNLSTVALSGNYNDLSNLPSIPSKTSDLNNDSGFINKNVNDLTNYTLSSNLATVATTGQYLDLVGTPNIPDSTSDLVNDSGFINKNSDDLTYYTKTSNLATVAISGNYNDLTNKPTIPSMNITTGSTTIEVATTNIENNSYVKYGNVVSLQVIITVTNEIAQWSNFTLASNLPLPYSGYTNNRYEFYGFADNYQIRCCITTSGNLQIFYNNVVIPAGTQLRLYTTYISNS